MAEWRPTREVENEAIDAPRREGYHRNRSQSRPRLGEGSVSRNLTSGPPKFKPEHDPAGSWREQSRDRYSRDANVPGHGQDGSWRRQSPDRHSRDANVPGYGQDGSWRRQSPDRHSRDANVPGHGQDGSWRRQSPDRHSRDANVPGHGQDGSWRRQSPDRHSRDANVPGHGQAGSWRRQSRDRQGREASVPRHGQDGSWREQSRDRYRRDANVPGHGQDGSWRRQSPDRHSRDANVPEHGQDGSWRRQSPDRHSRDANVPEHGQDGSWREQSRDRQGGVLQPSILVHDPGASSGLNGDNGPSGRNGDNGSSGYNGDNDSSGRNGDNGPSGRNGDNGSSGLNRDNDSSGRNGDNGSSGLNGDNDSSGQNGDNGSSGGIGGNGSSGRNGGNGSSGRNGGNGSSGRTGGNGSSGRNGGNGSSGRNGGNGSSGRNGGNGSSGRNGGNESPGAHKNYGGFEGKPQIRHGRTRGRIKKVILHRRFGFIECFNPPKDFPQGADVFFHFDKTSTALLTPVPNDIVEFTLSLRDRAEAFSLKIIECKHRPPVVWQKYLKDMLEHLGRDAGSFDEDFDREFMDSNPDCDDAASDTTPRATEDVLLTLVSCVAVWEGVGQCQGLGDETIHILLSLLSILRQRSHLFKDNFKALVQVLLRSRLFDPHRGDFKMYVERLAALQRDNDGWSVLRLMRLREFFLMCYEAAPERARASAMLLKPLVSPEEGCMERFLYDLLSLAAKGSATSTADAQWDELPLVPSRTELLEDPLDGHATLRPVKKEGEYESFEDYMDTYFRLLREDCFYALKKGIRDYLSGTLDVRDMRVWTKVSLAGIHMAPYRSGLAIALRLASGEDGKQKKKKKKKPTSSSNFMSGNLVCISPDGSFRDVIWAMAIKYDPEDNLVIVEPCAEGNEMKDSDIIVTLQGASDRAVLVESPTYYRAYQPVLRVLQEAKEENLPFADVLLKAQQPMAPVYISSSTTVDLSAVCTDGPPNALVKKYCESLYTQEGSTLDPSQEIALRLALRKQVAVIQGPPGTGKTFIGCKLVEMLLSMSTRPPGPILVLTYKNHALDEFLKAVSPLADGNVVRVGGRSKDPTLAKYNLSEKKKNYEQLRKEMLQELMGRRDEVTEMKVNVIKSYRAMDDANVWDSGRFAQYLSDDQINSLINSCNWSKVRMQLRDSTSEPDKDGFAKVKGKHSNITPVEVRRMLSQVQGSLSVALKAANGESSDLVSLVCAAIEQWLPHLQEFQKFEKKFEPIFVANEQCKASVSTNVALGKSTSVSDSEDESDVDEERQAYAEALVIGRKEIIKKKERNGQEPVFISRAQKALECVPLGYYTALTDLRGLTPEERVSMVQRVLLEEVQNAAEMFDESLRLYQHTCRLKAEMEQVQEVRLLQDQTIIAMTITGASIHSDLLQKVAPAIVIVEEAAEVLEPQLIAALKSNTQHLILIGDHKQLRPQVKSYALTTDFHLDISLMERLINNGIEHASLEMQNRMRPEFAELLKDIYPKLQSNHARVDGNKKPDCVAHSMFFWDHDDLEYKERSPTNEGEAKRAVKLALFLLQQGYQPRQVSIVSAYLGQVRMIRNMLRKAQLDHRSIFELYDDSLPVPDDKGLKTEGPKQQSKEKEYLAENRIEVSTIDMYQGDENEVVIVSLVRSNPQGQRGFLNVLNRRCVAQSRAKAAMYFIGNVDTLCGNKDWQSLLTGMRRQGNLVGRKIPLQCPDHPLSTIMAETAGDITLESFCKENCTLPMPCRTHRCPKSCQPRHDHSKCAETVSCQFKACGHFGERKCYESESHKLCHTMVKYSLACGHELSKACYDKARLECKEEVNFVFSTCGHSGRKLCVEDEANTVCSKKVSLKLKSCGHTVEKPCYKEEASITCKERCMRPLPCTHMCSKECGQQCVPKECEECEKIRRVEEEKKREEEQKLREGARKVAAAELEKLRKRGTSGVVKTELRPEGDTAAKYYDVSDRVKKYVQAGHNWFPVVTKIEEVTNIDLEKKWLQRKSSAHDPRYSELKFHGTTAAAVESIVENGFRMPKSGNHMFGPGIYFASDSSKSAQRMYTQGSNMLLLCEVLLGKVLTVDKAAKGMNNKNLNQNGYDSLYAKRGTRETGGVLYDEFVVYNVDQAIPRYIVHYATTSCNSGQPAADGQIQLLMTRDGTFGTLYHKNIVPQRHVTQDDPMDFHFRVAESQFLRLMQRTGKTCKVNSVDFYRNLQLMQKFSAKEEEFKKRGIPDESQSVLAFHGTNADVKSIVRENFRMDRIRRTAYGKGIYFSEFPNVSMGYGGQLLLCKVLPGKSYDCTGNMSGANCQPGFDSHRVKKDAEGRGEMLVIFNPDQILPLYVINYQ